MHVFSAKGAWITKAWGNAPGSLGEWTQMSALKARLHSRIGTPPDECAPFSAVILPSRGFLGGVAPGSCELVHFRRYTPTGAATASDEAAVWEGAALLARR